MGANYRTEWNTPVKAPVLKLSTSHGGLTPVKRGGGKQTKSLRVEDPSGRQYTLRSITKFITSKTLPGDLQSDAAADLVSDGIIPINCCAVKCSGYQYISFNIGINFINSIRMCAMNLASPTPIEMLAVHNCVPIGKQEVKTKHYGIYELPFATANSDAGKICAHIGLLIIKI